MRNGQNKRMRGRNRGKGGHHHHHHQQNPLSRMYESNGPDVKIRGNASHIAEKYLQLARDAQSSGDPVAAENYYQHAEHYFRLIAAAQEHLRQTQPSYYPQQQPGQPGQSGEMRGNPNDDAFDDDDDDQPNISGEPYAPQQPQYYPREQQQPQHQPHQQHQPQQHFQPRPQQQHFQPTPDEDVDRLPSFITGGQGSQPPQQNSPQQHSPQQYSPPQGQGSNSSNGPNSPNGPNGYDNQADRFPLHRRRRRHRGPRDHNMDHSMPGDGDAPSGQGPTDE
jgi:Domain of unknown function (DUF4167)